MWPILMAILRRNATYITLPIAGVIGFIGYNLEDFLTDKEKSGRLTPSIQDNRAERLSDDNFIENATKVEKLKLKSPVLERNLSPSLQPKA